MEINGNYGNYEVMHTTKQYFPTNDHATIMSLLTHFVFDSISLGIFLIKLNFTHSFYCLIANLLFISALHDEHLRMEKEC